MIFCSAVFDIGTSSLKGALINKNGKVYQQERLFFPKKIIAESWLVAFENLFNHFSNYAKQKKIKICGICISGNGPSIVSVSKEKYNLLLWNEPLIQSNFKPISFATHSIFIPRLELFKTLYPLEFEKAEYILSGQEFLIYKLTGAVVTTLPEKRYTQAYWTENDLALYKINKQKLAPFVDLGANCGEYRGIPVFAGPPDFISALIGTNTLKPGRACDRAGSSEGLNICVEKIPSKEKLKNLLVLPSPIAPYWNVSYKISNSGTKFFNYVKEHGGNFMDFNSFMQDIAKIPYSPEGDYPQTIAGQGKVIVEEIAYKVKQGISLLEHATGFEPIYTLCGGQAKCEPWLKLKEKITKRKFIKMQIEDAELLGNACIVFSALNEFSTISEAADNICKAQSFSF